MFIDFSLCSANDLSDPKHHRSCHVLVCHKWVSVLAIFHLATLLFFPYTRICWRCFACKRVFRHRLSTLRMRNACEVSFTFASLCPYFVLLYSMVSCDVVRPKC